MYASSPQGLEVCVHTVMPLQISTRFLTSRALDDVRSFGSLLLSTHTSGQLRAIPTQAQVPDVGGQSGMTQVASYDTKANGR